jgi:hypothetical protein
MVVIILQDLLNSYSYSESGKKVFDTAIKAISEQEIVVIDMISVDSVPTNFMNTSFGSLIDIFGIEKTKKTFKFRNILKSQLERIQKYFNDYQTLLNISLEENK